MSDSYHIERSDDAGLIELIQERTPARLFVSRAGSSYTTATQLQLRSDHARARDAVWRELDVMSGLGPEFVARWVLFEVRTRANSKSEFLLNPALGRAFDDASAKQIKNSCPTGCDLQLLIGDGLSVDAVAAQVPTLLPLVVREAQSRGWSTGRPFIVRYCRVGTLNDVGELLQPRVAVLLIGERPGMSTADSLSAYMAYRPRRGHNDAYRNLISNIHARGVSAAEAARRIVNLAAEFMRIESSGALVKEPTLPASRGQLAERG